MGIPSKIRIGDRFKTKEGDTIYEITGDIDTLGLIPCVSIKTNRPDCFMFISNDIWEYLGNYSKSNRFKEIYDILNDDL